MVQLICHHHLSVSACVVMPTNMLSVCLSFSQCWEFLHKRPTLWLIVNSFPDNNLNEIHVFYIKLSDLTKCKKLFLLI